MIRYFKLNMFSLFIVFVLFLITACNNNIDEKKADEKSTSDTAKNAVPAIHPVANLIDGPLDTLYTDSLTFVNLPKKKLVFRFIFKQDEHLTIHGWNAKGLVNDSFDTLPLLKLENGHPADTVNFGPDIYLGNVIIRQSDINVIWKALNKEKAQYVIFLPQIVRLKSGKHIGYQILVGNEKPGFTKIFAAKATGVDANPSPPKKN